MDQAQVMKREREDWTRLYHKTLKGIETMIDVQRMVEGYEEDSRRDKHNNHRDGGDNSDGQYQ